MNKLNLSSRKFQPFLFAVFLLLHTIASYYYISRQNITVDEPQYMEYAKRWLQGRPDRIVPLDDSKSPVISICWIPRIIRQLINPTYKLNDYGRKDQAEGRYMMILFSFLAALYVYKWCRALYGISSWWLPLLLLLFDPLYLAYSTLIITDLACGAFLVALLYHYRIYLLTKKINHFYITALFTGLGIVTKQTLLFVILLLPMLSVAFYGYHKRLFAIVSKKTFKSTTVFLFIVLFAINALYYFNNTFTLFGHYTFESGTFRKLQQAMPLLHAVPVPLPSAYIQSLDMIKAHAEYGAGKPESTYNGVYLLGELKLKGSFWYYYLVVLFYKMPVGILMMLLAGVLLFIKKFRKESFLRNYIFLVFPVFFFGVILSFFNQFQTGIRHLLLLFPLLYIALGKLFVYVSTLKTSYKIITTAAIVYSFISVSLYFPFIIPYTNEFAGDKKMVYKKILDSSIDYGQSDSSVKGFIETHTGYSHPSIMPATGRFAIPIAHIRDHYLWNKNPYSWYRKVAPIALYRHVILLYDIKPIDLVNAGLIDNSKNSGVSLKN